MIYKGRKLREISFPLGGIGTGSIGLQGNGAFADWEIFNRPDKGSKNGYTSFVIKAQYPDGKTVLKVLQGDHIKDLIGQYQKSTEFVGYGFGPLSYTFGGLPHFKNVKFDGKFPLAVLTFSDDDFPCEVVMTAFNPFIPLDEDNSSIPAALFDIKIRSLIDGIKYTVVFNVRNPFASSQNEKIEDNRYTAVMMKHAGKNSDEKEYGDLTVAVDFPDGVYQEYWYRAGWQDAITTFWNNFSKNFENRRYETAGSYDTCSVGASSIIDSKKSKNFRFVLTWNIPNCYNYRKLTTDENGNERVWKNYYATMFEDSKKSCFYCLENFADFYKKTKKFTDSIHTSTLDKAVIDAISSTLSVLKSPTVLRLEDGSFWAWEGSGEIEGSCLGTCTHVWSYVYSLCFLFPEIEKGLRNTEFKYDLEDNGEMHFRTLFPPRKKREKRYFWPCVDGQMATVIKIYRDWKLTGNSQWLKDNWDNVKKILAYAWSESNEHQWDRDKDGVLEGRQHHTLDMELFGPSSWLQGMYLGALKAASQMADFLGDTDASKEYAEIFEKGYKWTKENLFNGEYFYHKVDFKNKWYVDHFNCPEYWNEEAKELKYQIADGCEIDQILGQWHANICGLGDIFDKEQRQTALKTMLKRNFKKSMREVANMWRIFAINDEGGTIICEYPENSNKPVIPIPYCEECMTGFEYAFAGLLISEGFIEEGLMVVRAIRDRYDGEKRNPWNEIECGSNYARAMASFALLPIFSGFEFDIPKKHVGFAPICQGDFKCFWGLGTGWGDFIKTEKEYKILISAGSLELESISIKKSEKVKKLFFDGKSVEFTQNNGKIFFETSKAKKEIRIEI